MHAALVLAGAVTSVQGWQTFELAEGGITLSAPAPFELAASGADADVPQSVERSTWRSEGGGFSVQVTYERWKSYQFNPDKSLDIFARRQLGLTKDATIVSAQVGSLSAAVLKIGSPENPRRAILRAKSGEEAWQIDIRSNFQGLAPEDIEWIKSTIDISAQPEGKAIGPWGNLMASAQVKPDPRPPASAPRILRAARLSLQFPMAFKETTQARSEQERRGFEKISEWAAKDDKGQEAAITYLLLRKGQEIDLGGWVAAYGESLRKDGFERFGPEVDELPLTGASARIIKGKAVGVGKSLSIQIILVVRGREAWAIQTRLSEDQAGPIEAQVRSSLKLDPS